MVNRKFEPQNKLPDNNNLPTCQLQTCQLARTIHHRTDRPLWQRLPNGEPTQSIIEYLISNIQKIHLQPNVLDETLLRNAGIDVTYEADPQITVGVTKARVGLADTGSILEADEELLGSLLPEIHIAVLKSEDILPSLPDAMPLIQNKNAVFITGPSRTADIEMTLTIGVHGPNLHVFVDVSNSR
jgi:hypothetical protein